MAISSTGYPGTVDSVEAAVRDRFTGTPYGIDGKDDFAVSVLSAVDRTLTVAPGTAFGRHIVDVSDSTEQVGPLPSTEGWHLIVLRRTWGATNASTLTYEAGTTTRAIPAGRNTDPGVIDDQMLALVHVVSGNIVPADTVDLRTWASKVITTDSALALSADDYSVGTEAVIGGQRWRFEDVNGTGVWSASRRVERGVVALTFPTSGTESFNHNLGWTPTVMTFTPRLGGGSGSGGSIQVTLSSASNALSSTRAVVVAKTATAPYAGLISKIDWVAYE